MNPLDLPGDDIRQFRYNRRSYDCPSHSTDSRDAGRDRAGGPRLKEFEELATRRGIRLRLKTRTVPAAIAALQQGRAAEHDRLIAAAALDMGPCDALAACRTLGVRQAAKSKTACGFALGVCQT